MFYMRSRMHLFWRGLMNHT